jgi:NAD(P)-dependent dehydrogenase (short-subunit alcohol dehydrogenase family)
VSLRPSQIGLKAGLLLFLTITQVLGLVAATCEPSPTNMICVGGSSGMGKAAALEALAHQGRVMLISRSQEKLDRARQQLLNEVPDGDVSVVVLDVSKENDVQSFAESLEPNTWDSLVISAAAKAAHGPMLSLPTEDTRNMLETKLWTAYHSAKHLSPKLRDGGSVVFVAGILNRRPGINCVPLAMANGALEGLTRSLALEWGPRLRVNCLSPGFCDTERFDHMDTEKKQKMLDNTASSLPLQRVGQPSDMGRAIFYLSTAPFCTGIILDVDGGHGIRQYASPVGDPMRTKSQ